MLIRQLEPEIMDDPDESEAYDAMDHATVNQLFVEDFLALPPAGHDILDVGTGTARIPIELCGRHSKCRVMASDAAVSMLEIARVNVTLAGLEDRIQLHLGDAKALPFEGAMFDCVISNSLLHHAPEPALVIREMVRVCRPGGSLFVRDLMRPDSSEAVEQLVDTHAGQETEECQQLFRQSLIAALTQEELAAMIAEHGFAADTVRVTSDRHLTWAATKPARDE